MASGANRETVGMNRLLAESAWLARLARALVQDAAQRDDLLQDVWMAALQNPPGRGRERSWLRSVMKRRVADLGRASRSSSEPEAEIASPDSSPPEAAETLESHARLGEALRALPDPYCEVVVARYFHDETPQEIARRLGRKDATVRSQLARGLSSLRQELARRDERGWSVALIPLALRAPDTAALSLTGTAGATTTYGSSQVAKIAGVVMFKKVVVGVAGVVVAIGVWWAAGGLHSDEYQLDVAVRDSATVVDASNRRARRTAPEAEGSQGPTKANRDAVQIRVLDVDGVAIPRARVLVDDGERLLAEARADEVGRLVIEVPRSRAFLTASSSQHHWARQPRVMEGETEIRLERRLRLGGTLEIEGGFGARRPSLRFLEKNEGEQELPEVVRAALFAEADRSGWRPVPVDAAGRFAAAGFAPALPLQLRLGPNFAFLTPDGALRTTLSLERARQGLRLEIALRPQVTGRLIDAASGEPLARHAVKAEYLDEQAAAADVVISGISDAAGRFALALESLSFESLDVKIPRKEHPLTIRIDEPFDDTHDLGDIYVGAPLPWGYRVVDIENRPIKNARVANAEGFLGSKTDAEGIGRVKELLPSVRTVLVGAPDYRVLEVPVLRHGDEPQTIVLEMANRVVVVPGSFPEGVRVNRVKIDGPRALIPPTFSFDLLEYVKERSSFGVGQSKTKAFFSIEVEPDGRFSLQDLSPNLPFRVRAFDAFGRLVAETREQGLGLHEQREVVIGFDTSRFRRVLVDLFDENGERIIDFSMKGVEGGVGGTVKCKAEGSFCLVLDRRSPASVWSIEKEGFEPLRMGAATLTRSSVRLILKKSQK